jgi:hypothetical protein
MSTNILTEVTEVAELPQLNSKPIHPSGKKFLRCVYLIRTGNIEAFQSFLNEKKLSLETLVGPCDDDSCYRLAITLLPEACKSSSNAFSVVEWLFLHYRYSKEDVLEYQDCPLERAVESGNLKVCDFVQSKFLFTKKEIMEIDPFIFLCDLPGTKRRCSLQVCKWLQSTFSFEKKDLNLNSVYGLFPRCLALKHNNICLWLLNEFNIVKEDLVMCFNFNTIDKEDWASLMSQREIGYQIPPKDSKKKKSFSPY